MTKTAEILETPSVLKNLKKFRGKAFLFKLEPPFQGHQYVIKSVLPFETMYFPSDEKANPKTFLNIYLDLETDGYKTV